MQGQIRSLIEHIEQRKRKKSREAKSNYIVNILNVCNKLLKLNTNEYVFILFDVI